jgi:hypothetical protein
MQGQRRHKKQKYEHDSQLHEKQQDQSSKLFFVDFKKMRGPGNAGIPEQARSDKIEKGKRNTDDKCPEEKVPEENDLFVFHLATFLQLLAISKKPNQ